MINLTLNKFPFEKIAYTSLIKISGGTKNISLIESLVHCIREFDPEFSDNGPDRK